MAGCNDIIRQKMHGSDSGGLPPSASRRIDTLNISWCLYGSFRTLLAFIINETLLPSCCLLTQNNTTINYTSEDLTRTVLPRMTISSPGWKVSA